MLTLAGTPKDGQCFLKSSSRPCSILHKVHAASTLLKGAVGGCSPPDESVCGACEYMWTAMNVLFTSGSWFWEIENRVNLSSWMKKEPCSWMVLTSSPDALWIHDCPEPYNTISEDFEGVEGFTNAVNLTSWALCFLFFCVSLVCKVYWVIFLVWQVKVIKHKAVSMTVDNGSNMDVAAEKLRILKQRCSKHHLTSCSSWCYIISRNVFLQKMMSQCRWPLTFWILNRTTS